MNPLLFICFIFHVLITCWFGFYTLLLIIFSGSVSYIFAMIVTGLVAVSFLNITVYMPIHIYSIKHDRITNKDWSKRLETVYFISLRCLVVGIFCLYLLRFYPVSVHNFLSEGWHTEKQDINFYIELLDGSIFFIYIFLLFTLYYFLKTKHSSLGIFVVQIFYISISMIIPFLYHEYGGQPFKHLLNI